MSDDHPPTALSPRTRVLTRRPPTPARSRSAPRPPAPRTGTRPAAPSQARGYALGGLVLCLLALCACALGAFKVRTVQVVGPGLPTSSIADAAGVYGENIFTVRSDLVIARLASLPAVKVSRVETDFPDKVVIYATMRQPAAVWQSPHGASLVDRYGRVLGPATRSALPAISGPQSPDGATIVAMTYALRLLPAAPDGAIATFSLDPATGLDITGRSGWKAALGRGNAQILVARVVTLQSLLRRVAAAGHQLLSADVRYKGGYFRVRGS